MPQLNVPNNQEKNLSKYRLNRIEDLKELRERVGDKLYLRVWEKVKTNLNGMVSRQVFHYQKYIPENELEIFVKQACFYITQHSDYEFFDDYSAIRRTL